MYQCFVSGCKGYHRSKWEFCTEPRKDRALLRNADVFAHLIALITHARRNSDIQQPFLLPVTAEDLEVIEELIKRFAAASRMIEKMSGIGLRDAQEVLRLHQEKMELIKDLASSFSLDADR